MLCCAVFSPLTGGMVRVFDHDCIYLGVAVGAGNHRSFIAFIVCAVMLLLLFIYGCAHTLNPQPNSLAGNSAGG